MLWVIVVWLIELWERLFHRTSVRSLHDFFYFTSKDVTAYFYDYRRCETMSRPRNHRYYLLNRRVPFLLGATLRFEDGSEEACDAELATIITILKGRLLHNFEFPPTQLNDEELCVLGDIVRKRVVSCELETCP